MEVGQLCVKLAGRDAGKKCVIVDVLDNNFVLVDGETRRRKCNIIHLEPLNQKLDVKKGASHELVIDAFKKISLEARNSKPKQTLKRVLSKRILKSQPKPAKTQKISSAKPEDKPKIEKKPVKPTKKVVQKQEK